MSIIGNRVIFFQIVQICLWAALRTERRAILQMTDGALSDSAEHSGDISEVVLNRTKFSLALSSGCVAKSQPV